MENEPQAAKLFEFNAGLARKIRIAWRLVHSGRRGAGTWLNKQDNDERIIAYVAELNRRCGHGSHWIEKTDGG